VLGVVFGVKGLSESLPTLASYYVLEREFGVRVQGGQGVVALLMVPFVAKPLFGLISDRFPLYGRRRRPYILLAAVVNALGWALCAAAAAHKWERGCVGGLMLANLGIALGVTVAEAVAVQMSSGMSDSAARSLQSTMWLANFGGSGLGAAVALLLVTPTNSGSVFAWLALLPLLPLPLYAGMRDDRYVAGERRGSFAEDVASSARHLTESPMLRSMCVLGLVAAAVPSAGQGSGGDSLTYYLDEKLHYSRRTLAEMQLANIVGMALGVLLAKSYSGALKPVLYAAVGCTSACMLLTAAAIEVQAGFLPLAVASGAAFELFAVPVSFPCAAGYPVALCPAPCPPMARRWRCAPRWHGAGAVPPAKPILAHC